MTGLYSISTFLWRKQTLGTLETLLSSREREIPQELGIEAREIDLRNKALLLNAEPSRTSSSAFLYFSVGGCLWRASIAQAQVLSLRES